MKLCEPGGGLFLPGERGHDDELDVERNRWSAHLLKPGGPGERRHREAVRLDMLRLGVGQRDRSPFEREAGW